MDQSPLTPFNTPGVTTGAQLVSEESSVLSSFNQNLHNIQQNVIYEQFVAVEDPLADKTSSIFSEANITSYGMAAPIPPTKVTTGSVPEIGSSSTSSHLAAQVTGTVPDSAETFEYQERQINTDALKEMAIKIASGLGINLQQTYIEDLIAIAYQKPEVTDWDVWMYFKGVLRANQISLTSTLADLVKQMDVSLNKFSGALTTNSENYKLLFEKHSTMGTKIDNLLPSIKNQIDGVVPIINASVKSGSQAVIAAMNQLKPSPQIPIPPFGPTQSVVLPSPVVQSPAVTPAPVPPVLQSQHMMPQFPLQPVLPSAFSTPPAATIPNPQATPARPSAPGPEEIRAMCRAVKCPDHVATTIITKYPGKLTWAEYEDMVGGKTSAAHARVLFSSLSARK